MITSPDREVLDFEAALLHFLSSSGVALDDRSVMDEVIKELQALLDEMGELIDAEVAPGDPVLDDLH